MISCALVTASSFPCRELEPPAAINHGVRSITMYLLLAHRKDYSIRCVVIEDVGASYEVRGRLDVWAKSGIATERGWACEERSLGLDGEAESLLTRKWRMAGV